MLKRKLMILTIFLMAFLAVSAVNAEDNATGDVVSMEEITDYAIGADDNHVILGENDFGNFTELSGLIEDTPEGTTLELEKNYRNDGSVSEEGINITKALTIDGKGHTLDADGRSRIFNIAADNVTLRNIVFKNGYYENGGALRWSFSTSDGNLFNCSFVNCSSLYSAGAISLGCKNAVVSNCNFTDCSSIIYDDYYVSGKGGAIKWNGNDGTLSNSNFVNCNASENGGAIDWGEVNNCAVFNCSFLNCNAPSGGAMDCSIADNCTVSNCSFVNCSAAEGGAINVDEVEYTPIGEDGHCGWFINDCNFAGCTARASFSSGGAVRWWSPGGILSNCSFVNCNATSGGAVWWDSEDSTISYCSFANCNAKENGSAVYWYGGDGKIENSNFTSSHAKNGGAIYVGEATLTISSSKFENNTAEELGGVVYFNKLSSINNCTFNGNSEPEIYPVWKNITIAAPDSIDVNSTGIGEIPLNITDGTDNLEVTGEFTGVITCEDANITVTVDAAGFNYENGRLTFDYGLPDSVESSTLTLTYAEGDEKTSRNITLKRIFNGEIQMVNGESEYKNGNFTFALIDADTGEALSGRKLSLYVGTGIRTGFSAITDEAGIAEFRTANIYMIVLTKGSLIIVDLGAGNHAAEISAESPVNSGSLAVNLTVTRALIDIAVDDYEVDEGSDLNVTFNVTYANGGGAVSGITLSVNVLDEQFYVQTDENGTAGIALSGLEAGTYNVTASNTDTVNMTQKTVTGHIVVRGTSQNQTVTPEMTVPSLDEPSSDGHVTITLPDDATGTVTLTIAGEDYVFDVVDGRADVVLPDLGNGDYDYNITYSGDDKYSSVSSSGSLNVNNTNATQEENGTDINGTGNATVTPEMDIPSIDNISGEDHVIITLPADATGTVTLTVDGRDYVFDVVDGMADVVLPDLGNGDYDYNITYSGDDKYSSVSSSGSLKVKDTNATQGENGTDINGTGNATENITVTPEISIPLLDNISGEDYFTVTLPADATGTVTLTVGGRDYVFDVIDGKADVQLPELADGDYDYSITYSGDGKYSSVSSSGSLKVKNAGTNETSQNTTDEKITPEITVPPLDKPDSDGSVEITLPHDATGTVTLTVNGRDYVFGVVNGKANVLIPRLGDGEYGYNITYSGDAKYSSFTTSGTLTVSDTGAPKGESDVYEAIPESVTTNDDGVLSMAIPDDANGTMTIYVDGEKVQEIDLAEMTVTTFRDGVKQSVVNVSGGVLKVDLSGFDGKHVVTFAYSGDAYRAAFTKESNATVTAASATVTASDASVTYATGAYYTVTVYAYDGKPAGNVDVSFTVAGKVIGTSKTDTNGAAGFKVTQAPGEYKISASALGKTANATLKVKHLLKLKKVSVKRSARKLVLTATLGKVNGKYLKKKAVTFKFAGKKYKAKTNRKGVAQVTVKSGVLKKLKAGKKVAYQATYKKDTVKKSVKVKK